MPFELRTVRVDVPGKEYSVLVQPGLLAKLGPLVRRLTRSAKVALITDANVGPLYAARVEQSLRENALDPISVTLPGGEDRKTLADMQPIYDTLLAAGIERTTPILALGGGVVGDMAGFAAATILRGVPFVQLPTTLLAMVDASIGGKTGVNHPVGKNLIGAFNQPRQVIIDVAALKTLPQRELRSGLAECIKHEIIRDAEGFSKLEGNIDRALSLDVEYLAELVAHNVAIKADVVATDPLERGDRAHLNFGHTVGHALETLSNYSYSHGEAVALGMVAAARLSRGLGMIDDLTVMRIVQLIARAGLPTSGLSIPADQILRTMLYDKKVRSGRIRFILPAAIGTVVIRDDVPDALVREVLSKLKG